MRFRVTVEAKNNENPDDIRFLGIATIIAADEHTELDSAIKATLAAWPMDWAGWTPQTAVETLPRYTIAEDWRIQFDEDAPQVGHKVRFVFDHETRLLTEVAVAEEPGWRAATPDELEIISYELQEGPIPFFSEPEQWGLIDSDTLPLWPDTGAVENTPG